MRIILTLSTTVVALVMTSVLTDAQELNKIPVPECMGDYGCMHTEMHDLGLVQKLRKLTKSGCCDDVGECRPVWVKPTYGNLDSKRVITGYIAKIDGNDCPIPKEVYNEARILDGMPAWMNALLCVPKRQQIGGGCPTRIYCMGIPGET